MRQLFLLSVSLAYGILTGLIYFILFRCFNLIKKKHEILFCTIYFVLITLLYVALFYWLNNGLIHLYMKLLLVLGFLSSYKMSNLCKRIKK